LIDFVYDFSQSKVCEAGVVSAALSTLQFLPFFAAIEQR